MSVLSELIKKNRLCITVAVAAALLSNLSQMLYMVFIGELVNKIEGREHISTSFLMILVFFLISNAGTNYLNHYFGRFAAEKMAHSLRMGFLCKVIKLSKKIDGISLTHNGENVSNSRNQLKEIDTGSVMSKVQNELAQADEYLSGSFFDITGMLLTGILVFIFLLFQNILLTFILFIPTVLILLYARFSSRKLSGIVSSSLKEKEKMNCVAYSIVTAFPSIKVFDGEDMCIDSYDKSLERWGKHEANKERLYAMFNSLSGLMSRIPLLLLLTVGAYMVLKGKITMGILIVFLNLQKSLTQSIMNLPSWLAGFKVFSTNLSRLADFFDPVKGTKNGA